MKTMATMRVLAVAAVLTFGASQSAEAGRCNKFYIFLLDEPSSGLDRGSGHELTTLVKELAQRGKSVLVSTHDMEAARSMTATVGILNDGLLTFSRHDASATAVSS
jgi:ABC-type multidrug transport system ATPase subunit